MDSGSQSADFRMLTRQFALQRTIVSAQSSPPLWDTAGLAQVLGGVNEAGKRTASSVKDEGVVGKEEQEDAGPGPEQEQQGERGDEEDPVAVLARLHQVNELAVCALSCHRNGHDPVMDAQQASFPHTRPPNVT